MFFSIIYTSYIFLFFFFNDTATTEIYTLSLHDALPIYHVLAATRLEAAQGRQQRAYQQLIHPHAADQKRDRKSTRLNSSHQIISYAVFCLKKKKKTLSRTLYFTIAPPSHLHVALLVRKT